MDELLRLLLVLGIAAIPWGEVLVAVPLGMGMGLPPFLVFLMAFLGNTTSLVALFLVVKRWKSLEGLLVRGRRARWVARAARRYGIIGLSAQAPILSGVHAAMLVGLLFGMGRRALALSLMLSIAGWGVAITVLAVQGKQVVVGLIG